MKRIGIFQFYNKYEIVEEYIEILLKSISTVLSKLIIVCNNNLKKSELLKLSHYSDTIYYRENIGYDAGAYKDVFLKLPQYYWQQWDEVLLFNCTFYGPVFPWDEVFEQMSKKNIDFWGLSKHLGNIQMRMNGPFAPEHIQSYFLVIRKSLIQNQLFFKFWEELKYPMNYCEAVENFEWKFSSYFKKKGFKYESWLDVQGNKSYLLEKIDPCIQYAYEIIKDCKFPIIKCKAISLINFEEMKKIIQYISTSGLYDKKLIIAHIKNLNKRNDWKPFSIKLLEEFRKQYNYIYFFGNGKYANGLKEYFNYRGWKVVACVVSKPKQQNEIALENFKMDKTDGMIITLGKVALDEMESILKEKFNENQLLFPNMN